MHLAALKMCLLVVEKEASTSRIVLKTGQQEKLYPSTHIRASLQCHPQLILVKFENLIHSIFKNEKSALEINVRHPAALRSIISV